jgi:hypothetical protein
MDMSAGMHYTGTENARYVYLRTREVLDGYFPKGWQALLLLADAEAWRVRFDERSASLNVVVSRAGTGLWHGRRSAPGQRYMERSCGSALAACSCASHLCIYRMFSHHIGARRILFYSDVAWAFCAVGSTTAVHVGVN